MNLYFNESYVLYFKTFDSYIQEQLIFKRSGNFQQQSF